MTLETLLTENIRLAREREEANREVLRNIVRSIREWRRMRQQSQDELEQLMEAQPVAAE